MTGVRMYILLDRMGKSRVSRGKSFLNALRGSEVARQ